MTRTKNFLIIILLNIMSFSLMAGPGDTIMIQTFEFNGYPVGEGWLSPREGFFDFSEIDGLQFAKVFMHYTLKCDPSQSPACGEWDYISYIKVMEHLGYGYAPSYIIGGENGISPSEFSYMNDVSWSFRPRFVENIIYDNPNDYTEYGIGNGDLNMETVFDASLSDSRNYYLYLSNELSASGLSAGIISGMQFNVNSLGDLMKRLRIRLKQTNINELGQRIDTSGFITVYYNDTQFGSTSWQQIDFTHYFTWDGSSNIIIDISFDGEAGTTGTVVKGDSYSYNCSSSSLFPDNYLDFHGPDFISLPVDNIIGFNEEATVSFWLNGNFNQPQKDAVFEARDDENNRILNVHLPWDNGRIYWDAGNDSYYDRIEKDADNAQQYKGKWNHWAFVKKLGIAKMYIYLNGEEWLMGSGKFATIGAIDTLILGKGVGGSNYYDGKIDEFRIWSTALNQETIAEWMDKDIDDTHPNYENLLAYYKFNQNDELYIMDEITGESSFMQGIPQRLNYRGNRFKSFSTGAQKPAIKFIRHESDYTINTNIVVDSFPLGQTHLITYIQENEGEEPVIDQDIYVYPTYYNNYIYDENGIAIDSTFVIPDENLALEMIEYNTSEPGVEVLKPWEVGRFITPYGNNLSLGDDGWTWVYDVTDFQHLFHGDHVHIRAGNFQELLDMKLYFIEGTPPRDLLEIKNLYSANPQLSNFDEVIVDTTVDLLPEAKMFNLKTTLSGHWFGQGNNCAEFCPNTHSVDVNGNQEFSWEIIQECGENALYPQGGTWFYDRAGWCPGMPVTEKNLDLTPFINVGTDTQVDVDYDVEYDPYGNYVTEIYFVSYDEPNFGNDAAIEEIIAPSNFKLNGRYNPICGNPIIKIKNNGAINLNSLFIEYGVIGQPMYTYEWQGNLAFLEEEVVSLPTINADDFYGGDSQQFIVTISQPNNVEDEYDFDNVNTTSFELAPEHDFQVVIWFKTNFRPWENHYTVLDSDGNIVFEKDNFESNTEYVDTLNLFPGCYEFIAYDSEGDGMYNWPSNAGNGSIKIKTPDGTTVENLEKWFGSYLRYNFLNTAFPVSIDDVKKSTFNIYPNPSDGQFSLELLSNPGVYQIKVFTPTGSQVFYTSINNVSPGIYPIDLSSLAAGFYLIHVESENFNRFKKIMIEN